MSTFVNGKGGGITDPQAFKLALGVAVSVLYLQDLRDVDVTNITQDAVATSTHHSSPLDIGGGVFVWLANSTLADNDITVILPTGRVTPGRWVRLESIEKPGFINLAWTGARPNLLNYDNAPHFNAAIQALPLYGAGYPIPGGSMRIGTVHIPSDVWYVSNTINCSVGVHLQGEGARQSTIRLNPASTGFQNIASEKWMLYYHWDTGTFAYNNVFGARASMFGLDGDNQPGASGIYISGAQESFCRDFNCQNMGIRGGVFNVPTNMVWVAGCIKGPGFTTNIGPRVLHGIISSEHVNQAALYTMTLTNGDVVPVPAYLFQGAYLMTIEHLFGEDSACEVVLDNCVGTWIKSAISARYSASVANGYQTRFMHLSGDTYANKLDNHRSLQNHAVQILDNSLLALAQGDGGAQNTDFWQFRDAVRVSNINPTYPGPYATDAAAAASKKVPVGAAYRVTGGGIKWRTDIAPPFGAIPIYHHYAITQENYDLIVDPDPNTAYDIIP